MFNFFRIKKIERAHDFWRKIYMDRVSKHSAGAKHAHKMRVFALADLMRIYNKQKIKKQRYLQML